MALALLRTLNMPEPDDDIVGRKVVYETRSTSSNRGTGLTIGIIVVIALGLIIWLVMQMQ